ncbi:type II CAAX prenyl endopeptidase Rce1 family protein [Chroococcus sp. FPU101]|uniref:CPBP family glutamic-type intramembrane protease n=1 Tax=Chroococcus sp. FPU101 TaxID=1974212 RepID=UPI001A8E599B|nr:CPBP family glutamic-type intramembrane protease [Chroococcus sp. FPU101]GFE70140.1 hypothetical protein CFPU101_27500 [Chroococcus sp. FPU101]
MLIQTIINRITAAITTGVDIKGWLIIAGILLIYAAISIPIGLKTRCLTITPLPKGWAKKILSMIRVLIIPVIPEELLFRVILLPHPFTEKIPEMQWMMIAIIFLAIFIFYHPILALTVFPPGYPTFLDPIFLAYAGLLGLACTVAYRVTGSFWGIAFIHWLIDWLWIYCLGGRTKLAKYDLL